MSSSDCWPVIESAADRRMRGFSRLLTNKPAVKLRGLSCNAPVSVFLLRLNGSMVSPATGLLGWQVWDSGFRRSVIFDEALERH